MPPLKRWHFWPTSVFVIYIFIIEVRLKYPNKKAVHIRTAFVYSSIFSLQIVPLFSPQLPLMSHPFGVLLNA